MKVLIWFGCFLIMALVQSAFFANGIRLGAIPTVLLFLVASGAARALCKKWDEKHRK